MSAQLPAAALAFAAVLLSTGWIAGAIRSAGGLQLAERQSNIAAAIGNTVREGQAGKAFGGGRLLLASSAACALFAFAVAGPIAAPAGIVAGPLLLRAVLRGRGRRRAARIDACSADFAQAMASGLAAGRSVRGALISSAGSTPEPLASELDRALVDLTLGGSVHGALLALRSRTGSQRIEAMAGAIELHHGSGGDLVKLMRELAAAFRERDRALQDAHSASAQARFTSYIVAAIPLGTCALLELVSPGLVSGAASFAPSAVMLVIALALLIVGVLLCRRIASTPA